MIKKTLLTLILIIIMINNTFSACGGKIFNPITDVCWSCIFPISIGNVPVSVFGLSVSDAPNTSTIPCVCPGKIAGITQIGIPIGFWEGIEVFDLSKDPFCFVNLGGIKVPAQVFTGSGSETVKGDLTRHSTWHLHNYAMPIFKFLSIVFDSLCVEISTNLSPFDVAYMTEVDPLWMNDELTFIINPEAAIFGNSITQAACVADCAQASVYIPNDTLFWCAGCQGGMYPMTGNIRGDNGELQSSLLALERFIFKMHRELQYYITSGVEGICQPIPAPIIKKTQYRSQLTFPVPMILPKGCKPLGASTATYDSYKVLPTVGESFGYLLWRKRNCCSF